MQPIIGWALWLGFGNFLAAAAISFFALSSVYDKVNLRRYSARLRYLYILFNITMPVDVDGKEIEVEPEEVIDNTLLYNLLENLFEKDIQALSTAPPFYPEPYLRKDCQKYTIYHNKSKIPDLIKDAKNDFMRWEKIYKTILKIFILGLTIQFISIIGSLIDP